MFRTAFWAGNSGDQVWIFDLISSKTLPLHRNQNSESDKSGTRLQDEVFAKASKDMKGNINTL